MPAKREFKPRKRKGSHRDASLLVIATEGSRTERKYFLDLVAPEHYQLPNVHLTVVDRPVGHSSPRHVIASLDNFKSQYQLKGYDELWMVIDKDRWDTSALSEVAAQCISKGYKLCVSNPDFELWLLLHIKDFRDYSPAALDALEQNARVTGKRTQLEVEIVDILGEYNKSNLDTSPYITSIDFAIGQARQLDTNTADRWPRTLGTRMYLLVERIIR